MKHSFFFILLLSSAFTAQAQVYKCNVDGKTVFTDLPCASAGQKLPLPTSRQEAETANLKQAESAPPRLATSSEPVLFNSRTAADMLNYTLWSCSLEDTDRILESFSRRVRDEIAEAAALQTESPTFYTNRLCKMITKLVKSDLQGKPEQYVYATTMQDDGTRLCILVPGATNLDKCVSGIRVTLEEGSLKFDETQ